MGEAQSEQKRRLRQRFAVARHSLDGGVVARLSALACERVGQLTELAASRWVVGYAHVSGEIDPADVLTAAALSGKIAALPKIVDGRIEFRSTAEGTRPGWRGIPEPNSHAPQCPFDEPAVIVVPGVAFDRDGRRLGRGSGHYDRALQAYPNATRVGLAFELQMIDQVPVDPWDVPMHFVVTEARVVAGSDAAPKENRA